MEVTMPKTILTSVLLALFLVVEPLAVSTPAEAVSVNISIGTNLSGGRAISCAEGARRVRSRGFRDVRRIDCRGRYFIYRGWRGNRQYEIAVRRSNGRVVDVHRIGRRR
jgi:hypothetical protein